MKGAHLHVSNFLNESRIIKETVSLADSGLFDSIIVICLWAEGLQEEEFIHPKVKVVRLKIKNSAKPVSRLHKFIPYFKSFIKVLKEFEPDVINIHQVKILPVMPVLWLLGIKVKYIYDTHELETETISLEGSKLKPLYKAIENACIRRFALTIVVTDSISRWYQTKYGINNIVTVRNCPVAPSTTINEDLFRINLGIGENVMIFLYQGGISKGRGVELILKSFSENPSKEKCIVFLGYGPLENLVKEYSEQHENIYFHPAVSPDLLLNYTSSADVGLSLIENTCLNEDYCLPNKLFEYIMAQKPVIVSDLKDQREFVNQNKIGVVMEEFSSDALTKMVSSFTWDYLNDFKKHLRKAKNDNHWGIEESKMVLAYKKFIVTNQ